MPFIESLFYDRKDKAILPYLISPSRGSQDRIIIGPSKIDSSSFLEHIYARKFDIFKEGIYARVVKFKSYTNVYICFETNAVEPLSLRTGLCFTIGALFKRNIFRRHTSSDFMRYYLQSLSSVFKIRLSSEANQFIKLMLYPSMDTQAQLELLNIKILGFLPLPSSSCRDQGQTELSASFKVIPEPEEEDIETKQAGIDAALIFIEHFQKRTVFKSNFDFYKRMP